MIFYSPQRVLDEQNTFGRREVGISHPDLPGFIRIADNGDIEIVAEEGLMIVMNPRSRSITFVADHIKFMTKHEGGLRWNSLEFNDRANRYNEPTFVTSDYHRDGYPVFKDVEEYTDPIVYEKTPLQLELEKVQAQKQGEC